jgi:neutral ceramidase
VSYLADNATAGVVPSSDPAPPDLTSRAISLRTGVVFDSPGIGHNFGDKLVDVPAGSAFTTGQTVTVQFVGANPRNNQRLEGTFLSVERLVSGNWQAVRSDSHPSTIYRWLRTNGPALNTLISQIPIIWKLFGTSTVNISWTIEPGTPSGTYRLVYFGDSKPFIGSITSFTGTSSSFQVS